MHGFELFTAVQETARFRGHTSPESLSQPAVFESLLS